MIMKKKEMSNGLQIATLQTSLPLGFENRVILVVDHEELIRELVKTVLEISRYTVLTANNGRQAIDIFQKNRHRISLVIIDFDMPGMNGYECSVALLKMNASLKIIVSSCDGSARNNLEKVKSISAGFINKPFRMQEMVKKVKDILGY